MKLSEMLEAELLQAFRQEQRRRGRSKKASIKGKDFHKFVKSFVEHLVREFYRDRYFNEDDD